MNETEVLAAQVTTITYLTQRVQIAVAALHEIAARDYRGSRPQDAVTAHNALREMRACECHTEATA